MDVTTAAKWFGVKTELMWVILAGLEPEFFPIGGTIDEQAGGLIRQAVLERLKGLFDR